MILSVQMSNVGFCNAYHFANFGLLTLFHTQKLYCLVCVSELTMGSWKFSNQLLNTIFFKAESKSLAV